MRAWYPFYPKDFMVDTMQLTLEEECLYRRLLDVYYLNGGPIIFDDIYIGKSTRIHRTKLRHILPKIVPYFQIIDGKMHHKRMDAEIEKSNKISKDRAEMGRRGGLAKAKYAQPSKGSSKPQPSTIPIVNNKIIPPDPALLDRAENKAEVPHGTTQKPNPKNGNGRDHIPMMSYSEQDVVDLYNEMLPELIPIKKLTWRLEHDIRNIHTTTEIGCHEIAHWTNFFKRVQRSDWITGRANGKPSRYSLRKLIEPEVYAKIAEGTYD